MRRWPRAVVETGYLFEQLLYLPLCSLFIFTWLRWDLRCRGELGVGVEKVLGLFR